MYLIMVCGMFVWYVYSKIFTIICVYWWWKYCNKLVYCDVFWVADYVGDQLTSMVVSVWVTECWVCVHVSCEYSVWYVGDVSYAVCNVCVHCVVMWWRRVSWRKVRVFKFLDFVCDAVYIDLKYDDVFDLWLIVVCEWLGGDLSAMGCCVVCAVLCCYDFCGCVYGASPVRFVLSLFYLCAIQMNPVCVWLHLIEVCCCFICLWQMSQIHMTGACVSSGQDLIRHPPLLWGAEPAMRQGATDSLPKNGIGPPSLGQGCVDTICTDVCSIPTSCRLCLFGTSYAV